jgi:hypothetical protein
LGALSVLIINLGLAVELDVAVNYSGMLQYSKQSAFKAANNVLAGSSSGAVLFTNNICQLESRASGVTGLASVEIFSLDHVIFSNDHCWLDGGSTFTAWMDALLFSLTLNASGNRFQESVGSVLASGFTFAIGNITTQNISTFCLFPEGPAGWVISSNNLMFDCAEFKPGQ